MPIRCTEFESLLQAYLDDELADNDANELEEHRRVCEDCRRRMFAEQRFHDQLRVALAPPSAPAGLHDRLVHALDQEDWRTRPRRRATQFVLPGAATLAAAAALIMFVTSSLGTGPAAPTARAEPAVADEAVLQHMQRPPIEVQGAAVSPWLQKHYRTRVEMPRFDGVRSRLRGARQSKVGGRQAVQFFYDVHDDQRHGEVSLYIFDPRGIDFTRGPTDGQRRTIGERELWVADVRGYGVVAHEGPRGLGYLFTSADMDGERLLELVVRSNLLGAGAASR